MLSLPVIVIHFPNGIVIPHTKQALSILFNERSRYFIDQRS
jgi:hypothetical protein